MKKYQFKTNINCGGCLKTVTPFLDVEKRITRWEVAIDNPSKILTVETDDLAKETVQQIVKNAGYTAEALD